MPAAPSIADLLHYASRRIMLRHSASIGLMIVVSINA